MVGQALLLESDGGNIFGGSVTLYLSDWLGIEGRLDAADQNLVMTGATYRVVVDLPAPLADASGDLEVGSGPMDMERIRPLSLNLKLRTTGPVRLALSGGLSYLPALRVISAQAVRLRSVAVPGVPAGTVLATVGLRAEGIALHEGAKATRIAADAAGIALTVSRSRAGAGDEAETVIRGSHLLVAAGRKPGIDGLGLDAAGVAHTGAGITVDVRVTEGLPLIHGDQHQLTQLFTNLLTNAFEAMEGRGRVTISASPARMVDGKAGREAVLVDFTDEGPGMPPDVAERVFSPFFTTKPQGSGLGLAIVRKIVDAHDGTIDLQTSPGQGTKIRIMLPVTVTEELVN